MRGFFLLLTFFLFSIELFAQPGPPPPDPGRPVPLQGFLFLIIGGAILGFKKILAQRKGDNN
jgi:hypothetical protein